MIYQEYSMHPRTGGHVRHWREAIRAVMQACYLVGHCAAPSPRRTALQRQRPPDGAQRAAPEPRAPYRLGPALASAAAWTADQRRGRRRKGTRHTEKKRDGRSCI